ncbi:MAG: translational GTPase TypA, partial [Alphaproteobacteria bacterium]|nr:translational GTPase TypA [Alphaproteobacteria bacterium]
LVDSSEGPMPQTRFVLKKSLEQGLKPILVINKIDKSDARPAEVVDMVLELFMELEATDEQMEFPILYGAAKDGIMKLSMDDPSETLEPLFKTLINHVEDYPYGKDEEVQMQISSLKYDKYLGRLGLGRLKKGTLKRKGRYSLINAEGDVKNISFSKIFVNDGLDRREVEEVEPGDLCIVAGIPDITIGDTISTVENPVAMEKIEIEEPTISMNFLVNKSPLNGREGKKVTSSLIEDRLTKELETNVALKVNNIEGVEGFEVQGRGELHLSVLIENMRREGFELAVSKPKVLVKEVDGKKLEPYEIAQVTCDDEFSGAVIQLMSERKGTMTDMHSSNGQTNIDFIIPTRGLIGIRQSFITKTRGTGILEKTFHEYGPYAGVLDGRKNGVLVSNVEGKTMGYSL